MRLASATVGPFKSISNAQTVTLDQITVFVGMNEAGKTVFLQALQKSRDALNLAEFDPVEDYPRRHLRTYMKEYKEKVDVEATRLTYELNTDELKVLNASVKTDVKEGFTFSVIHRYDNTTTINIDIDERPVLNHIISSLHLSPDAISAAKKAKTIRELPDSLKDVSLTDTEQAFLSAIEVRIRNTKLDSVAKHEAWQWLSPQIPAFMYFGDYDLLPSKTNLTELAQRVAEAAADPKLLTSEHRGVLALLRMADLDIADFATPGGYEPLRAKIEGVSISLTDQIMEFWKQNEDLEVVVDIQTDSIDMAPYNNGPNLYLRIANRRHRGVTTPFRQRSRGFIWFFSFLVWFDNVQHQLLESNQPNRPLILLLDEPGLSLHALAQQDFLRYIENLAKRHQVLYTTHSPFMVDQFSRVRLVEDRRDIGTVITDTVVGADKRTLFPLQAALGWTIAQNLFISERNLLVEGPADLLYLQVVSALLEQASRVGLRGDITIVPTGSLDKVATFVALLGANSLKMVVLHDYRGVPDQKLMDLVRDRMISTKAVLNASQFRDADNFGENGVASDLEDLFSVATYLEYFNAANAESLPNPVDEASLPPGDRIVDRLNRYLDSNGIQIRPSGGFNHYLVALQFARTPPTTLDAPTFTKFEELFKTVNMLL